MNNLGVVVECLLDARSEHLRMRMALQNVTAYLVRTKPEDDSVFSDIKALARSIVAAENINQQAFKHLNEEGIDEVIAQIAAGK